MKKSGQRVLHLRQTFSDIFAAIIVAGFPGEKNPFLNQIIGDPSLSFANKVRSVFLAARSVAGILTGARGFIMSALLWMLWMLWKPNPSSMKLVSPLYLDFPGYPMALAFTEMASIDPTTRVVACVNDTL